MRSIIFKSVLLLSVMAMNINCAATEKKEIRKLFALNKDVGYGTAMSDSVADIIISAQRVVCMLQSPSPADSLRQDSVYVLPAKMNIMPKYILFNPENFKSDDVVYGGFVPWACFKFVSWRNREVTLELDFGLRKWRLIDYHGQLICQRDMRETHVEFLRLIRFFFPNDHMLQLLNENIETKL